MKDFDNEDAGCFKRAAAIDAQLRNKSNEDKYSLAEKNIANEVMALMTGSGMNALRYFVNYRDKVITVKAQFDRQAYMHDNSVVKFSQKVENAGHKVKRMLRSKSLIVELKTN